MTDRDVPKSYEVEMLLPVSEEVVWQAVTEPKVLRQWFGWDYDGLDDEIRHIFVDEVSVPERGRMRWADGSYLEVAAEGELTRVRAVRDGGADDPKGYDAIEEGWRAFLLQLRFLLAERPEGARRTVYLTGASSWPQAKTLAACTSPPAETVPAGARMVWFVDAEGHLVVIAGREPVRSKFAGRMEVTITTYGLDDAAYDVVRKRWAEKWTQVARNPQVTTATTPAP